MAFLLKDLQSLDIVIINNFITLYNLANNKTGTGA